MALHEGIPRLVPTQQLVGEVVQHEIALIGGDGENRMAIPMVVEHHGRKRRRARPTGLDEHLALQEHEVAAIAGAVIRIGPPIDERLAVEMIMLVIRPSA